MSETRFGNLSGLSGDPLEPELERMVNVELRSVARRTGCNSLEEFNSRGPGQETRQDLTLIAMECRELARDRNGIVDLEETKRRFFTLKHRVRESLRPGSHYFTRQCWNFQRECEAEAMRETAGRIRRWQEVAYERLPDQTVRFQDNFAAYTAIHVSLDAPIGGKDSGDQTYAEMLVAPSGVSEGLRRVERAVLLGDLDNNHLMVARIMADDHLLSLRQIQAALEEEGCSRSRGWVHARKRELAAYLKKERGCRNDG